MKRKNGWNQEVTDAQGRRRFHGAFTGGFSAGHFNSVGTEEGWTPATFESSRARRAELAPRRAEDFMDEEDDPLLGKRLETSAAYDTLQQNERQRLRDAAASSTFASVAAGAHEPLFHVPNELIAPLTGDSIGKKLLSRMGWKDGHGIGPRMRRRKLSVGSDDEETKGGEDEDAEEEVHVPPRNTVDVRLFPKPKIDKYGAGFDPYEEAPEFRRHKLQQADSQQQPQRQIVTFAQALGGSKTTMSSSSSSRVAMGFGLSALEENDDLDVYDTTSMDDFDRAIAPAGESIKLLDSVTSQTRDKKRRDDHEASTVLCSDGRPALEGFRIATKREKPPKTVIQRLVVPSDFRAYHVFDENEEVAAIADAYGKFNFSTEKHGLGSTMTASQRAKMLQVDDERDEKSSETSPKPATGSVFDLLHPAQRQKLMVAAQATRERKPLTQGAPSEQFRANIMASISKRFVSASTSESTTDQDLHREEEKKSYRSTSAWAPHVLLCKRFHAKCEGQTISGGVRVNEDGRDLFSTELGPHLVDLAASRRADGKRGGESVTSAEKRAPSSEEKLPPLPVVPKPSRDLLRSIFEPSDGSEAEEDAESDRSDSDGDSDCERKRNTQQPESVAEPRANISVPDSRLSTATECEAKPVSSYSRVSDVSTSSDDSDSDVESRRKRKKKHHKFDEKKKIKSKKDRSKKSKKKKSRHSDRGESSRSSRSDRKRSIRGRSRSRSRSRDRFSKDKDAR